MSIRNTLSLIGRLAEFALPRSAKQKMGDMKRAMQMRGKRRVGAATAPRGGGAAALRGARKGAKYGAAISGGLGAIGGAMMGAGSSGSAAQKARSALKNAAIMGAGGAARGAIRGGAIGGGVGYANHLSSRSPRGRSKDALMNIRR